MCVFVFICEVGEGRVYVCFCYVLCSCASKYELLVYTYMYVSFVCVCMYVCLSGCDYREGCTHLKCVVCMCALVFGEVCTFHVVSMCMVYVNFYVCVCHLHLCLSVKT